MVIVYDLNSDLTWPAPQDRRTACEVWLRFAEGFLVPPIPKLQAQHWREAEASLLSTDGGGAEGSTHLGAAPAATTHSKSSLWGCKCVNISTKAVDKVASPTQTFCHELKATSMKEGIVCTLLLCTYTSSCAQKKGGKFLKHSLLSVFAWGTDKYFTLTMFVCQFLSWEHYLRIVEPVNYSGKRCIALTFWNVSSMTGCLSSPSPRGQAGCKYRRNGIAR